jgi:hypothetical protein
MNTIIDTNRMIGIGHLGSLFFVLLSRLLFTKITCSHFSCLSERLPGRVEIFITKKGLDTHDGFVPFEQITHFYIPPGLENKLYLHTKRNLMQVVIVSLENIDHDKVRDALEPYIKEKEIEEPFVSVVSKMLGL